MAVQVYSRELLELIRIHVPVIGTVRTSTR